MDERERRRDKELSAQARAWLAEELEWEARLDQLRRPGRSPQASRRPRPTVALQRAS